MDRDMKIHIDYLINGILTCERIRPAMLLQIVDFRSKSVCDKTIDELHNFGLIAIENYGGIIFSKSETLSKYTDIGEILGYPEECIIDFNKIVNYNLTDKEYENMYSISLTFNYIINGDKQVGEILVNRCIGNKEELFYDIVEKSNELLKTNKYKNFLNNYSYNGKVYHIEIINFELNIEKTITIESIINKMKNYELLNENDIYTISNFLYNYNLIDEDNKIIYNKFDQKNPNHISVILTLLLFIKDDPYYKTTPEHEDELINMINTCFL